MFFIYFKPILSSAYIIYATSSCFRNGPQIQIDVGLILSWFNFSCPFGLLENVQLLAEPLRGYIFFILSKMNVYSGGRLFTIRPPSSFITVIALSRFHCSIPFFWSLSLTLCSAHSSQRTMCTWVILHVYSST